MIKQPRSNVTKRVGLIILIALSFIGCIIMLLSILFAFLVYDPIDYVIAKSIPVYPNAREYEVTSSSAFPGGTPAATVRFYTDDPVQTTSDFYRTELSKGWLRWTISKDTSERDIVSPDIKHHELVLKSSLPFIKTTIHVNRGERDIPKGDPGEKAVTIFVRTIHPADP